MKKDVKHVRAKGNGGFSMVEVSLALLVAAVGLFAVIGLFPVGLEMNRKAIDETYSSFFADSVFASYKGAIQYVGWDAIESYEPIPPNTINRGADVVWKNSQSEVLIRADGNINTIRFIPENMSDDYVDHALRYRLQFSDIGTRRKALRLEVWPGEFGAGKPEVFYTEIFDYGI